MTAILIPGDFIEHGLSSYNRSVPNQAWPEMLAIFETVINMVVEYFPNTPILPAIGNNDCYYHDMAPELQDQAQYYTELQDIFFKNVTANAAIYANQTIMDTWMTGGYYAYQLTDDLMLITLNGIYPFTSNRVQVENGTELMLNWLNDTLNANPNMKFMTQVHVFFGRNYYQGEELFWYTNFTDKLMEIFVPF